MTLRVSVLDHTAAVGGAELALLRLLAVSDRERVVAHLVLFSDGELVARAGAAHVPVDVLPLAPDIATVDRHRAGALAGLLSIPRGVAFVARLARRLRADGPDVVHANSLKAYVLGLPAARLARVPLVWWVHDRIAVDYLPATLVEFLRWTARRFPAVVIANSRATARTLPGARGMVVAYPGYAPEQELAPGRRPERSADPVVLLLGRISPTKGQLDLVRAAATVHAAWPAARFRLVGDPLFGAEDYARRVDHEIEHLGLGDVVHRVPAVEDPTAEIDRATVVVHASPTPEPFGQVVVEAMIRAVPVVATDAGGIPEILAPSGEEPLGLLVPPGDPEALAGAIETVLRDPVRARERADRARVRASERFAVGRTAEVVFSAWEAACARRRPRRLRAAST
ncbi:glycosyltransferase family 4 protein [Isoptericola sp. AK164]|uniref:glycosyltransferase family 4 protein n=1 Tax=Isoptericola sp. AK164 TaxID=3024246 RepID=UPI0024184F62|nr:glycosyltransferase family 4 protein [Isoptericola sp. AK164]